MAVTQFGFYGTPGFGLQMSLSNTNNSSTYISQMLEVFHFWLHYIWYKQGSRKIVLWMELVKIVETIMHECWVTLGDYNETLVAHE